MCVHVYTWIFIGSSVHGHLDYFYNLIIVNNAAVDLGVQKSFQYFVFISFGYVPKSVIARLYSSSIFKF